VSREPNKGRDICQSLGSVQDECSLSGDSSWQSCSTLGLTGSRGNAATVVVDQTTATEALPRFTIDAASSRRNKSCPLKLELLVHNSLKPVLLSDDCRNQQSANIHTPLAHHLAECVKPLGDILCDVHVEPNDRSLASTTAQGHIPHAQLAFQVGSGMSAFPFRGCNGLRQVGLSTRRLARPSITCWRHTT